MTFRRYLPVLQWGRRYSGATLVSDLVAALIVTVLLIPQSLAYAILAGLPPQAGLYASILPLAVYALLGSSMTLSVGPVAITALMTASAIQGLSSSGVDPLTAAVLLSLLAGLLLLGLGLLRFGFLANFLSHPVVAGFITASAILIALNQSGHILGVRADGDTLLAIADSLLRDLGAIEPIALIIGLGSLAALIAARRALPALLRRAGLAADSAALLARLAPLLIVVAAGLSAWYWRLDGDGLALVGTVPSGLPRLHLPTFNPALWLELLLPASMIALIGYVESVSVGRTLGARRRQKIDPDQELIGMGAANLAAGFSGGFPVSGGFSRSVVNFEAGAETPVASLFTALGIAIAALYLTDLLAWLPRATLAATIIVAVAGLIDFSMLPKTWRYSRSDFIAISATILVTLALGVELGVLCGVLASLLLHLYKTSRPHIAEVGEIEGTEHFRNVKRHRVMTHPAILSLRIDARLYFANAAVVESEVLRNLAERPGLRHVILMCSAVNEIDISALDVLEEINERLQEHGIGFHLSEVKGPVMDALQRSDFLAHLHGEIFLSQHEAVQTLSQRLAASPAATN